VFGLLCAEMLTRQRQKATSARAFFVARGVSDSFIRSAAETLFRSSAEGFYLYTYTFQRKIGSATHNSMCVEWQLVKFAFITGNRGLARFVNFSGCFEGTINCNGHCTTDCPLRAPRKASGF